MSKVNSNDKLKIKDKVVLASQDNNAINQSIFNFIFKEARQRNLLLITLIVNGLLLAGYKYFYPLPDFYSDSYGYVIAAVNHLEIFYRPLGYSHFLNFLHNWSDSSFFVVAVQYYLLSLASLFCFFTVDYFYRYRHKVIRIAVWALITFNILYLPLANQVASDSLFTALTIIWFTLLLWVINRGNWLSLGLQVIVLMFAFEVRYNALYFLPVACICFLISKNKNVVYRIVGTAITVFAITWSYNRIKETTEQYTNAPIFAGFSGWLIANNALYIAPFIHLDTVEFEEPELRTVQQFVNIYKDSLEPGELQMVKRNDLYGSVYLWSKKSPLKMYLRYYCNKNRVDYMAGWYQVSETFTAYGKHIIQRHVGEYIRYFLIPNTVCYFFPSGGKLSTYNADGTTIADDTRAWFHFNSIELKPRGNTTLQQRIVAVYPAFHVVITVLGLLLPAILLLRNKRKKILQKRQALFALYWYAFFLLDAGFSIIAIAIELRYQAAWFVLIFCVPLWFLSELMSPGPSDSTEESLK